MKIFITLLAVGLVVLAVAMFANSNTRVTPQPTLTPLASQPATAMPSGTPTSAAGSMQTIDLTGEKFRFSKKEIRVKRGDKVRVNLTAVDMPHDFKIDELNVAAALAQPGETVMVEFTASQVGQFEYYCSYGQHRAKGMVGTLTVEE